MSTIEAILAGGERIKGHASKTKWKQLSLALTRDSPHISIKAGTRNIRRFFVHMTYTKINELKQCVRSARISLYTYVWRDLFTCNGPPVKTT